MSVYQYRVETTKVVLYTWAKDEEAAIRSVMDAELCPRRSIVHVMKVGLSNNNEGA